MAGATLAGDGHRPTLRQSLAVQSRVITALLMREVLTRYGRHNIGFLWLFVEPMIFTIGVTALWTLTKTVHGSTIPITAFALTGYSSVLLWRNMPGRCINALAPNLPLLYHRDVRMPDILLARLLLELAGATMSFLALALLFHLIGWTDLPENLAEVIGGWALLAWFGMALALLLGALSVRSELVEKLWHPLSYLTFPLSGAAFMVDALPHEAQGYVLLLPMVHAVEMVREGYFGASAHAHYDVAYVIAVTLILTFVALLQLRLVAPQIVIE
ncbi:ABC transporter permease [Novosphingobium sp.]|uniref:ABC transporter permease n=1 Tax=Novosphingobium sp. TaxID=1874826 RepID=UPI003341A7AC